MKHTKLLSVILALIMTIALTQAVFVQSFAAEGEATSDEPKRSGKITVTSIEIINANDEAERDEFNIINEGNFYENLELLINYSDGSTGTYSSNKEGYNSISVSETCYDEDFHVYVISDLDKMSNGEQYVTYELAGCTVDHKVNVVNRPTTITKIEITKLPDKVFDEPLYTESFDEFYANKFVEEAEASLDEKNSVAANMQGAEITLYRANGETEVYPINSTDPNMEGIFYHGYFSRLPGLDNGITIRDIGNYSAEVTLSDTLSTVFTANHTDESGELISGGATDDEAMAPIATDTPSTDVTSSTEDTATKDSLAPAKNDNGTVATGSAQASAVLLTVLVIAGAVAYAINRKKFIG